MYQIELRCVKSDRLKGYLGAGQTVSPRGDAQKFKSVGDADRRVGEIIRADTAFARKYTFTITEPV